MSLQPLCSSIVQTRRGLLAFLWSLVTLAATLSFVSAIIFSLITSVDIESDDANKEGNVVPEIAVTSRAMGFAALWTAVLASIMSIFGTVILGVQSPTGQYYTCCSGNVHRTTPLGVGAFIGAVLMFANVTLVCSVLFGEFQIRDDQNDNQGQQSWAQKETVMERSSKAFSIMCMFLTIVYFSFGALTYVNRSHIVKENEMDIELEENYAQRRNQLQTSYTGYIDNRFDVRSSTTQAGYVVPLQQPGGSGSLI